LDSREEVRGKRITYQIEEVHIFLPSQNIIRVPIRKVLENYPPLRVFFSPPNSILEILNASLILIDMTFNTDMRA
jgi:hypothetical protein